MIILVYNLSLIFLAGYATCCPETCRCTIIAFGKQKADCSSEGLFSIPANLPEDTKILDLSNNPIGNLSNDILVNSNVPLLEEIYLSGHSMDNIEAYAFRGLSYLQTVDLSRNNLFTLRNETFKENNKVVSVNLRHNPFLQLPENGSLLISLSLSLLDLGYCNIQHISERTFSSLPNLQTLLLDNNEIQNVSSGIFSKLENLIYLDLSVNEITYIEPNLVLANTKLKTLLLNSNNLYLPEGHIFSTFKVRNVSNFTGAFLVSSSLENLELIGNYVYKQYVSENFFCKMPNLKKLSLKESYIMRIGSHFNCLTKLVELDLSLTGIYSMYQDCFDSNHLLTTLNMSGSNYIESIFSRTLKYLDLSKSFKRGLRPSEFPNTPNITHLILTGTPIGMINYELLSYLKELEYLDISSTALAYIDSNTFSENSKLRYLSLRNNVLTYVDNMREILNIPSLETLDMSSCKLTNLPEHVFENLPRLQTLYLKDNPFNYLPENIFLHLPLLKFLDLSNCQQVSFRPKMFSGNSGLVTLLLRGNPLYGIAYGGQFINNTKLETLDLQDCELYRIHPNVLSNLVRLETLYLDGNFMKNIDIDAISSLHNLRHISLSGNHWRCDCKLKSLFDWTVSQKIKVIGMVFCQEPEDMIGLPWYQLSTISCDENLSRTVVPPFDDKHNIYPTTNNTTHIVTNNCNCLSNKSRTILKNSENKSKTVMNSGVIVMIILSLIIVIGLGIYLFIRYRRKRRIDTVIETANCNISEVNLLHCEHLDENL